MSIYLIRHTAPAIEKGICYGQTDIDVAESFYQEASIIKNHLPQSNLHLYCSPLMRCKKLAEWLFPGKEILYDNDLMEIHCGHWEMKKWDDIPKSEIDPWMNNFVHKSIPGGESYADLYERVTRCFEKISKLREPVAIITHGGVIRSILSRINQVPLEDSFKTFSLHYSCVVSISPPPYNYAMISNIAPPETEQHKPSHFYRK